METFAPGDRVVAINTDLSAPMHDPAGSPPGAFSFPDGPLRKDVVYHVDAVDKPGGSNQGVFITGLRVLLRQRLIPWDARRFRKVDTCKNHPPRKRRKKQPSLA